MISSILPKNEQKKIRLYYYGTSSWIVFVRFLGELKALKRQFEIKWALQIKKTNEIFYENLYKNTSLKIFSPRCNSAMLKFIYYKKDAQFELSNLRERHFQIFCGIQNTQTGFSLRLLQRVNKVIFKKVTPIPIGIDFKYIHISLLTSFCVLSNV